MIGGGKSAYDCVIEELKVLKTLEHPNIIYLTEIIDDPKKDHIFLVTDYYSLGSLGDNIEKLNEPYKQNNDKCKKELRWAEAKTKGLQEHKCRLYFIYMLKALHYCHKIVNVIHRDIKPDNIMLNHNNNAVLIDFGVSCIVEE